MFGRACAKVANVAQVLRFLAAGPVHVRRARAGRGALHGHGGRGGHYDPTQQHSTAPSETKGSLHWYARIGAPLHRPLSNDIAP